MPFITPSRKIRSSSSWKGGEGLIGRAVRVDLVDRVAQLAVDDFDLLHRPGSGVEQSVARDLLRRLAGDGLGRFLGGDLVLAGFQVETGLRLLQGFVRLLECGLARGVLEQDVGDVVLHGGFSPSE
jgi:hypothetical protein